MQRVHRSKFRRTETISRDLKSLIFSYYLASEPKENKQDQQSTPSYTQKGKPAPHQALAQLWLHVANKHSVQQQHAYLPEMHCQRTYTQHQWLGNYEEVTYSFPVDQGSQQTAHPVTDCVESNQFRSRFRARYWNRRINCKNDTATNCLAFAWG